MKIAFLSGSLSQRKDGVGDYTQRLRSQLALRGARTFAVAVSDAHLATDEETDDTLRLARAAGLHRNLRLAAERLEAWRPDWISLQFVPYSFASRGILRPALAAFGELDRIAAKRHIMAHELWIGQSRNDSLKNRLVGCVQRHYVEAFLRQYRPDSIHVSNGAYVESLAKRGWPAEQLPLFSNIPIAFPDRREAQRRALPVLEAATPRFDPSKSIIAVVFGSVHREWNPTLALDWMAAQCEELGKRAVVAFLGRNGEPALRWKRACAERPDLDLADVGEQPESVVSAVLAASDLGLATTPSALLGKSGSYLAMSEHGIPSVVVREDWIPRSRAASPLGAPPPGVYLARDLPAISLGRVLADRRPPSSNLQAVGDQMLAALERSSSRG